MFYQLTMQEMTIHGADNFILKNQILQYYVILKTLIEKHQSGNP